MRTPISKKLWTTGAMLCLTAVILGALAAHAVEKSLTPDQIDSFETAVRFQFYHGLALLIVPSISIITQKTQAILLYVFLSGTLLFSASIYVLTTDHLWGQEFSFMGPITPVGGILLIIGWFILLWKIISYKYVNN